MRAEASTTKSSLRLFSKEAKKGVSKRNQLRNFIRSNITLLINRADHLLDVFRKKLASRGARGIIGLGRSFKVSL
jgi:hypothetical protein